MSEDLLNTAIHEAGHAVAFLRLFEGRVVDKVSIVPKDGVHGSHRAEELVIEGNSELTDEHQKSFEDEAVYACAGYAALIVAGRSEDKASAGCWQDFEEAASACDRPLEDLKRDAVSLMARPKNRRAVERISKELHERRELPGEVVEVLSDVADGETSEAEYQHYLKFMGLVTP